MLLGYNINAFVWKTETSSQLIANQWGRELVEINVYLHRSDEASTLIIWLINFLILVDKTLSDVVIFVYSTITKEGPPASNLLTSL